MIILGFFVFLRLTKIKNFYFENPVVVNGTPLASPIESRKLALRIYVFSYMAMLISYIFFIIFSNPENAWINYDFDGEYKYILTGGLIFLINHIFSYFYNINNDSEKISLDKFISVSFIRLIPMHLTLLFIGMGNSIVILLSIKTLLDCLGHTTYHDRSEIESI